MQFDKLKQMLTECKQGGTHQAWLKGNVNINYKNKYLRVVSIETSNVQGGSSVKKGKQWSIVVELLESFENLLNWKKLKSWLGDDIKVTPVVRGVHKGYYGIRLYKMSQNPTEENIMQILNFVFDLED